MRSCEAHPGAWSRKQMGQGAAKDPELMSILLASNIPSAWADLRACVSLCPQREGGPEGELKQGFTLVLEWSKCHMASLPRTASSFFSKNGKFIL